MLLYSENRTYIVCFSLLFCFAFSGCKPTPATNKNSEQSSPKLVLQITVDALREDLLKRYKSHFSEHGLNYLIDGGVYYENAHYQHANTETIVGHTSLATGTIPAIHGMVGNVWLNREQNRLVYNIEDGQYRLLSESAGVDQKTEIDPTQKTAKSEGRSPTNILTSTFSDELATHFAGRSKIFAVSVKDRGAVSMAGQHGKAYWFSKASGQFVSSNYYYTEYPKWVTQWNQSNPTAEYSQRAWHLQSKPGEYVFGLRDNQNFESDFPGFGRTFPHEYGSLGDKYFTTRLTLSPAGDQLTLEFAKALIENEQLGLDETPDFLSISFSSTDYVGHIFGASSLESEDNLLHLDRVLADLFSYIDQKIGLENTIIAFSADHGQPEVPEFLHAFGNNEAHYFDKKKITQELIASSTELTAYQHQLSEGQLLIQEYFPPYLYLNHVEINASGLSVAEIQKVLAKQLRQVKGVSHALTQEDMANKHTLTDPISLSVAKNYHPKRSGDIYIVLDRNVYIADFGRLQVSSTHGSPWPYDTHVPVIFAGMSLSGKKISRAITPYDVAPTLSALLKIAEPSGSIGNTLNEVIETRTSD